MDPVILAAKSGYQEKNIRSLLETGRRSRRERANGRAGGRATSHMPRRRRRASWLLGRTEVVVVWQELPGARSLGARCWVLGLGEWWVHCGRWQHGGCSETRPTRVFRVSCTWLTRRTQKHVSSHGTPFRFGPAFFFPFLYLVLLSHPPPKRLPGIPSHVISSRSLLLFFFFPFLVVFLFPS